MANIVVIYQSKYGSTKKYAEWLSEELSGDLIETKKATVEQIEKYDAIILGGGIYATGIAGISFLKKHYNRLKDKNIVVFAVGASPYDEKAMAALRERNFRNEFADIPCFYCRGAWNEDIMSWKDRTLCNMLKKAVAKKDSTIYEPWEAALMQAIGSSCDWTEKQYIKPIIEYVQAKLCINQSVHNLRKENITIGSRNCFRRLFMSFDRKISHKYITILIILILTCIVIRSGVAIWENYNLNSKFTANPDEPYQQRIPIAEEEFIDDYIYRLYSPFAVDLMGRPNTFVLKQPISYYSAPDDNIEPVITLDAGKKYIIYTDDINNYKYGIQSWPTYKKGWRFVIPFVEAGNEKLVTQAYYVKLRDLYSPVKTITGGLRYLLPKGYNYRKILLIKDEMLYKEGCYLSPDLQKPIMDGWNIILLVVGFCLVVIKTVTSVRHCTSEKSL